VRRIVTPLDGVVASFVLIHFFKQRTVSSIQAVLEFATRSFQPFPRTAAFSFAIQRCPRPVACPDIPWASVWEETSNHWSATSSTHCSLPNPHSRHSVMTSRPCGTSYIYNRKLDRLMRSQILSCKQPRSHMDYKELYLAAASSAASRIRETYRHVSIGVFNAGKPFPIKAKIGRPPSCSDCNVTRTPTSLYPPLNGGSYKEPINSPQPLTATKMGSFIWVSRPVATYTINSSPTPPTCASRAQ